MKEEYSVARRESSRSENDASSTSSSSSPSSSSFCPFTSSSIPRRSSTTSLKTVRSLDQSPIKEEGYEKSLSLKRSLTRKLSFFFEAESSPSGWNGLGSLSNLKNLGTLGLSKETKKPPGDTEPEEEENDSLKKRLSRRLSSLFDGVASGGNSEVVLPSGASPSSSPVPDTGCNIRELRPVKRRDLPICWLDTPSTRANPPSMDLLTRLASRVYTRHLAREILQHLSKQVKYRKCDNLTGWFVQDLTRMATVCPSWRKLCLREMASGVTVQTI